uniref:hypothetical protein n=1 Tax=Pseudomonas viridiflava TaxID=33069 RepID=UPI001ADB42E1
IHTLITAPSPPFGGPFKNKFKGVVLKASAIIVLPFVGIAGTYGKWPMTNVGILKILKME